VKIQFTKRPHPHFAIPPTLEESRRRICNRNRTVVQIGTERRFPRSRPHFAAGGRCFTPRGPWKAPSRAFVAWNFLLFGQVKSFFYVFFSAHCVCNILTKPSRRFNGNSALCFYFLFTVFRRLPNHGLKRYSNSNLPSSFNIYLTSVLTLLTEEFSLALRCWWYCYVQTTSQTCSLPDKIWGSQFSLICFAFSKISFQKRPQEWDPEAPHPPPRCFSWFALCSLFYYRRFQRHMHKTLLKPLSSSGAFFLPLWWDKKQRWLESHYPSPLMFQKLWIRVRNFSKFENPTPVQTPVTIDAANFQQRLWLSKDICKDHTDSCYCRKWSGSGSGFFTNFRLRIQVRKKRRILPEPALALRICGHLW